jgi:hypothetical protein
MKDLLAGDLSIEVRPSQTPDAISLVWKGKSIARQPSAVLNPFFKEALELARSQSQSLRMHFEELEFFNSSTITSLIQLIQEAEAHRVPLTLCYKPSVRWQKMSMDALRIFINAEGVLNIEGIE